MLREDSTADWSAMKFDECDICVMKVDDKFVISTVDNCANGTYVILSYDELTLLTQRLSILRQVTEGTND